jgi:hypothetical protein
MKAAGRYDTNEDQPEDEDGAAYTVSPSKIKSGQWQNSFISRVYSKFQQTVRLLQACYKKLIRLPENPNSEDHHHDDVRAQMSK